MPKLPEVAKDLEAMLALGADPGTWGQLYPELSGFLCCGQDDDGKPMGETMLTLRRRGTSMVVTLKLEYGGLCCQVSGDAPDRAIAALEAALKAGMAPWQPDAFPLGRGKGKKR